MGLDGFDGGQEAAPLQTVLVQVVRRHVAGRHQRDAAFEQALEQLPEDHRIADVGDEELVETDHPGFQGNPIRYRFQRVTGAGQVVELAVHPVHEPVKVHA